MTRTKVLECHRDNTFSTMLLCPQTRAFSRLGGSMPVFGKRSEAHLATLDPDLALVLRDAIEIYDFSVICGYRGEKAQNEAFATGASKKQYPESIHNESPSLAVDVAPYPIDWNDNLAFARLFGIIEACAHNRGMRLRWGGDWDNDGESNDQSFMDIGHLELRIKG